MAKQPAPKTWYYEALEKAYGKAFAIEHFRTKGRGPGYERKAKGYWKTRLGKPKT